MLRLFLPFKKLRENHAIEWQNLDNGLQLLWTNNNDENSNGLSNYHMELRLLLIDNDPVQYKVKTLALKSMFSIERVKNTDSAKQALLKAQQNQQPFDLILIDMIPIRESYIDINTLLSDLPYDYIPFIFVISMMETLQRYIEQMPNHNMDVVLKPISTKHMIQRIEADLSDRKPARLNTHPFMLDDSIAQQDFQYFMQHLSKSWIECIRANEPVTLIALNIDYFQLLKAHSGNDTVYHYIRVMMSIFHSIIYRQDDMVVRSRRDDFYILLPGCNEIGAKQKIALINKFIVQALMPHDISPVSPFVSVSSGYITQTPNTLEEIQIFFDLAKSRLDQVKTLRDMALVNSG